MGIRKSGNWITFYPIAFLIAVVFTVAMIASITNTVVFESYGFASEDLYLEYLRKEVERLIPLAITLDSVVLLLEYKFLSRLSRRIEIEKATDFTIGTYLITFALWLSYAMFHGLSGEYPPMALVVTWLSLGNMAVCGAFFYMSARRARSRNMGR